MAYNIPPGGGTPPPYGYGAYTPPPPPSAWPQLNSMVQPPAYQAPQYKAQAVAYGHFNQPQPQPPPPPTYNPSALQGSSPVVYPIRGDMRPALRGQTSDMAPGSMPPTHDPRNLPFVPDPFRPN